MKSTKTLICSTIIVLLTLMTAGCSKTLQPEPVMAVEGIALDGYDPVAYFVSAEAVKPDGHYATSYEGLTWHFADLANKERFEKDPQAYIPAIGGFCAYAVTEEKVLKSDPEYWYIHNKTLYLFEDEEAKEEWFMKMSLLLPLAQKNWEALQVIKEAPVQE